MPRSPNTSYYAASARPFAPLPALEGAHKVDLCVIGGGFTGLSAALAASEAGMSVILLEGERIGFGASGRNGGQLIPGLRWPMRDLAATFGMERARALFGVALAALQTAPHDILLNDVEGGPQAIAHVLAAAGFDDLFRP